MLQTPAPGLGIDPHPESLGGFDRPHITGRVLIPNRLALLVQRGLRENGSQLSLAGLGLWVLLTRTTLRFTGHDWNPAAIVSDVELRDGLQQNHFSRAAGLPAFSLLACLLGNPLDLFGRHHWSSSHPEPVGPARPTWSA